MKTEDIKNYIINSIDNKYNGNIITISLRNDVYDEMMGIIKKDIGKKPIMVPLNDYLNSSYCWSCNEMVHTWEKYCPFCGQKIDWDVQIRRYEKN